MQNIGGIFKHEGQIRLVLQRRQVPLRGGTTNRQAAPAL